MKFSKMLKLLMIVVLASLLILSLISVQSWQYKIIVEVSTPEGIKTGYAVRKVTRNFAFNLMSDHPPFIQVKGEGVVIDLGERGLMVSAISHDDYTIVLKTFPNKFTLSSWEWGEYYQDLGKIKESGPVATNDYPLFVHFKDPYSSASAEVAFSRNAHIDRLDEIYGTGVRLRKITLELTDESVSWELQKWLPWVPGHYVGVVNDGSYNGVPLADSAGNKVANVSFSFGR